MSNNKSYLNKLTVLQLNSYWMPVEQKTIKAAIIAMTSDGEKTPPCLALDIEYKKVDGEYDFSEPEYLNAVGWDEWIKLPIREYDLTIRSAKMEVRAPTILVAPAYRGMPSTTTKFSNHGVFQRDKGICQYTGEYVPKEFGNVDHVHAQSKGGASDYTNTVWCRADINSLKGDKSVKEMGLNLLKEPKAPLPIPRSASIVDARHHDWKHFLLKK